MLTLLTMTGCRPEAWALCEKFMERQTFTGPVHWIVVDDGEEPHPISFRRRAWSVRVVRPAPYWSGQNTQARNILAGLDYVYADDRVAIIEDDDYYAPGYLEAVNLWLKEGHDIVGECPASYYNVKHSTMRRMQNKHHASLCSTAVQGSGIGALREAAQLNAKFIDIELWRSPNTTKKLHNTDFVLGIKGLPGRPGIGSGHEAVRGSLVPLKNVIGEDAGMYQCLD